MTAFAGPVSFVGIAVPHLVKKTFPAAKALASEVISVKPFPGIRDEDLARAKEIRKGCREVICTLDPDQYGHVGKILKELL